MKELKTDIEVIKNDLKYIRGFIDGARQDHANLEKEVIKHRQEFTAHINKVRGAGLILTVLITLSNLMQLMPK